MIDYTILYRSSLSIDSPWDASWDVFISSYNDSDRVKTVFQHASALHKIWAVHSEYKFSDTALPSGAISPSLGDEAEFFDELFQRIPVNLSSSSICVDITGMMRPHVIVLPLMLFSRGVTRFDVLYSEPTQYKKQEHTQFSILPVVAVRPVRGFEGSHNTSTDNDLLVIGSGYDDALIAQVAEHKRSARKRQMFGWPSLRPDMYQENVLRARRAAEAVGAEGSSTINSHFAPANDPFVTASILQEIVLKENARVPLTNLYLSPLATKPQALGFALYYIHELQGSPASIIFPFATAYSRETSTGIAKVWRYTVERLKRS